MANDLYTKGRQNLIGSVDLLNDTIKASLVDTGVYSPSITTDEFIDDIPNNAIISTQTLSGKSITDGVFDASNPTFINVPSSANTIELVVIWQDTGTPANSALIAYIDTATGLPTTPNDGNITVTWDDGTNKIFKITTG